jgi:hypothetical protein
MDIDLIKSDYNDWYNNLPEYYLGEPKIVNYVNLFIETLFEESLIEEQNLFGNQMFFESLTSTILTWLRDTPNAKYYFYDYCLVLVLGWYYASILAFLLFVAEIPFDDTNPFPFIIGLQETGEDNDLFLMDRDTERSAIYLQRFIIESLINGQPDGRFLIANKGSYITSSQGQLLLKNMVPLGIKVSF